MAQSYIHAQNSARHFKAGTPEDYLPIHEKIDSFKQSYGDVRHRAFFHNTQGPWLMQEIFGRYIEVEDWVTKKMRKILVREIAENHIVEDLGCLPSPGDWMDCMNCHVWMGGKKNKFVGREEVWQSVAKPGLKEENNE